VSAEPYFAYGTTQRGFPHHRRFAHLLGEPVGRFRTEAPYAVVVPRRAACSNPGCEYVHRMALLVPGVARVHAEGDLFLVDAVALAELDRLETAGPYVRCDVAVTALGDGGGGRLAYAYVAREPERWLALVQRGAAEAVTSYPRELAHAEALKDCCVRSPGHAPPHDVVDPLR
jgi:gamma-glutamylcyclotransferase (GGCT)/AIG2-like uncharacterized protein YtfP